MEEEVMEARGEGKARAELVDLVQEQLDERSRC